MENVKQMSLFESSVDTARTLSRGAYEMGKGLVQTFYATPILMDKVEGREKKVCSPMEDGLISLIFSGLAGGAFILACSAPNGENMHLVTSMQKAIAASPIICNACVNVYRMVESRMHPERYDQNPSCGAS